MLYTIWLAGKFSTSGISQIETFTVSIPPALSNKKVKLKLCSVTSPRTETAMFYLRGLSTNENIAYHNADVSNIYTGFDSIGFYASPANYVQLIAGNPTASSVTISGQNESWTVAPTTNFYGAGTYTCTSSDPTLTGNVYKAFNNVAGPILEGSTGKYSTTDGTYVGTTVTTTTTTPVSGEWLQIMLPYTTPIAGFSLKTDVAKTSQRIRNLTILGSNDQLTWTIIRTITNLTYTGDTGTQTFNDTRFFNSFRFVINRIGNSDTATGSAFYINTITPTMNFQSFQNFNSSQTHLTTTLRSGIQQWQIAAIRIGERGGFYASPTYGLGLQILSDD